MADLPAPPVPGDADLRHYPEMPLEVARLRDSGIVLADAEVFRCAVLLWCASWHQVPAGSLADDDAELCRMVGLGRDLRSWRRIRDATLRGWRRFADGRLYHRVVCEKVVAGLNSTATYEWNKACARIRKENLRRRKARMDVLAMPEKPEELFLLWPVPVTEREPETVVRFPEREFSSERKGKDYFPKGVVDERPLGTGNDSLQIAASAEGPDGPPAHDSVHELLGKAVAAARMPACRSSPIWCTICRTTSSRARAAGIDPDGEPDPSACRGVPEARALRGPVARQTPLQLGWLYHFLVAEKRDNRLALAASVAQPSSHGRGPHHPDFGVRFCDSCFIDHPHVRDALLTTKARHPVKIRRAPGLDVTRWGGGVDLVGRSGRISSASRPRTISRPPAPAVVRRLPGEMQAPFPQQPRHGFSMEDRMRSKLTLSTVALVATGAIPVHADQAAGNTCAAGLTGDGKQIYAAALARNPDKNNIKRTMEVVVSELAQAGKITRGVTARDNGGAAAQCVAAALR